MPAVDPDQDGGSLKRLRPDAAGHIPLPGISWEDADCDAGWKVDFDSMFVVACLTMRD